MLKAAAQKGPFRSSVSLTHETEEVSQPHGAWLVLAVALVWGFAVVANPAPSSRARWAGGGRSPSLRPGPALGALAMLRLKSTPDTQRMAGGRG